MASNWMEFDVIISRRKNKISAVPILVKYFSFFLYSSFLSSWEGSSLLPFRVNYESLMLDFAIVSHLAKMSLVGLAFST